MAEIGKTNLLAIAKTVDFGVYLDGGELGEILLPRRHVQEGAAPGDKLEVFLYFDSEDRLIATTEKPRAGDGEFAFLKVVAVNPAGAFLDWGLPKDLLVPFGEQQTPMRAGNKYVVHIYVDRASRRVAVTGASPPLAAGAMSMIGSSTCPSHCGGVCSSKDHSERPTAKANPFPKRPLTGA